MMPLARIRSVICGSALAAAFLSIAGCALTPDRAEVVRDLAPTGTLRVGINFGNSLLTKRPAPGGAPSGIAIDLAHELANRLGIPLALVAFDTPGQAADAVTRDAWDIVFLAAGPERGATIDFSPPYVQLEAGYLVAPGSSIRSIEDVDRSGVRIAVGAKTAYELHLSRTLRNAELLRVRSSADGIKLVEQKQADALAALTEMLRPYERSLPGSRILPGYFALADQAVGAPKGRPAGARFLAQFVEEAKASGLIDDLIRRNNVRGVRVAPAATSATDNAPAPRFQFAAIGDTGYSRKSEQELDRMIEAMNREDLAFVVHVGDFENDPRPHEQNPAASSMPCTDEHFQRVLTQFQSSKHPFIYTPGDNDWTDCHFLKSRKVEPLERLAKLREMFYPAGRSLGKRTMPVSSQGDDPRFAKFRENLAWSSGNVTFATFHLVGSNDNKGRTPEMDAEASERTIANIAWLKKAFADAKARGSPGLVLMTQANPGFETHWSPSLVGRYFRLFPSVSRPGELPPGPFDDFLNAVAAEMESYDKPTLFVHGDTHIFHVSKPLMSKRSKRLHDNFTRLEVFGDPDSHWTRITVDATKPALFSIEPEIVPENRMK